MDQASDWRSGVQKAERFILVWLRGQSATLHPLAQQRPRPHHSAAKVQACLARMSRRRCFSAFNTWHANARELAIQRRKVQTLLRGCRSVGCPGFQLVSVAAICNGSAR